MNVLQLFYKWILLLNPTFSSFVIIMNDLKPSRFSFTFYISQKLERLTSAFTKTLVPVREIEEDFLKFTRDTSYLINNF